MPKMASQTRTLLAGCSTICLSVLLIAPIHAADPPDYALDIQPLLAAHCIVCHGPDEAEAGLRLDQFATASEALDSGKYAIVAGNPEKSELLHRVRITEESARMPPDGPRLSKHEIDLLTRWIQQGAEFKTHWAYRPIRQPIPPQVNHKSWPLNPIDHFVLAKLEAADVVPSPPADPTTLVKRLYYDLIGLPPDRAVANKFLSNPSESGYQDLVDHLLHSEHFGERWGRHWLDKARYADSDGYEKDRPRPNAWLYRDWVINAINQDLPFDQFTIDQLAGDLLPKPTQQQQLATAFHRQTLTNTEGGTDQEQFRVEATFDRTETTSAIWLGLTMTCARCHTHKYDQITQREYYQLFAFFDDLNETKANLPYSEAATQAYKLQHIEHLAKVDRLKTRLTKLKHELQPELEAWVNQIETKLNDASEPSIQLEVAEPISIHASSEVTFEAQPDGSQLVVGPILDRDKYTVVIKAPEQPLTGIKIELVPDPSLPANGPGRAKNGNFVLTQVRGYSGFDKNFEANFEPLQWTTAEADHSQNEFSPEGALSDREKSGWAIAPSMGKPHHWLGIIAEPLSEQKPTYIQVILDQQYGGQHTIGRFRILTMTGSDTLRRLPSAIAESLSLPSQRRSAEQRTAIGDYFASQHPETKTLLTQLAKLEKNAPKPPTLAVRVVSQANRTTRILHRGDFLQPAEPIETGILGAIKTSHPMTGHPNDQPRNRLDLAHWLVDEANPLTPRVVTNQIWAHLFGRGIVSTVNDFGVRGDAPSHPALLDWMAWNFPRDFKWSRKALIRTIVMSATYRQASNHRQELLEIDSNNQLLARQNRFRVSAEVVRDLHLAASGLLSSKVKGPSVFPPLPPGVAELSYANNFKWKTSPGEDAYRRGMYTFFKRTSPHPTLISFDCPDSNTTQLQRSNSNTPLQALATLNNGVFTEAAQALSLRVLTEGGDDDLQKLQTALQIVLTRQATEPETRRFQQLLIQAREYYTDHLEDAKKATNLHRFTSVTHSENAAWVATLRMILNLDEFIVRD
ncbi:MAG: PSD1 and planctomycete cytochrome C domain-containing protein [Rubripirellula sp.]|nr:PSD1 and planctomycete cytochrome C domain-containing protein [Rubripirellula sp.]